MTKEKHLYRIEFITSIFLLLFNDLYLKYEYHNYLTGKLSDFAGLFAFPYFFSCFFPKKIKPIYIFSGVLFVLWKSELSQPIFDFAHSYEIGIDRTIDYSDLVSLLILPISYHFWKSNFRTILNPNKVLKRIIIGVCCFSFVATTLPHKTLRYNFKSDVEIIVKSDLLKAKNGMDLYKSEQENRYIYVIQIPKRKASIVTKIKMEELQDGYLKIQLDSILNYRIEGTGNIFLNKYDREDVKYLNDLSRIEIEKLFLERLKKQLNEK
ncbi:hypothetical protein [Aquimarina sp. 2201CG5-10]|uniref:hypothetical protein n=1 Tax=Aquimarina callyspongiae TaxID=3098150 RepID=UPI002AB3FF83|nr:hypothetical protein [Aquimarina sp. 2201CG5-10]MDY8134458.1 hypothetical protein [Aquimarina sp. 2201CG5-10]